MESTSPNSLTEVDADGVEESEEMATASLFEVMTSRNRFLEERELWALCRESCLTLEYVHDCHDLFQSLSVSPDTVAFDPEGNLCFLDLDTEPGSVYLPPEHAAGQKTYKTHLYSLGMTLLFATEFNTSSDDPQAALSEAFTNLLTTITHDDSERRSDLHTVLYACETALAGESSQEICMKIVGSRSSESPQSKGPGSGGSFQEMTDELSAYLESQTDLVQSGISNTICSAGNEVNSQSDKHGKRKTLTPDTSNKINKDINDNPFHQILNKKEFYKQLILHDADFCDNGTKSKGRQEDDLTEQAEKHKAKLLADLLTSLDRSLDETELWSICRECVLSLQRKKRHLPAYISLNTMIMQDSGSICVKAIPEDTPLEVIYMAPELQQRGILNEKTCLYGLGISLRIAVEFKYSSFDPASNSEALEILITSFVNANPDMRPDLDTAFEMCEEYEKVSKTSSQHVCLQLFEEAMKMSGSLSGSDSGKIHQASYETIGAGGSLKPENNIAEVPQSEEQRNAHTLSPGLQSAFKTTESSLSDVTKPQPLSAFKHVVAESKPLNDKSRIPTAFSSPATHFKPIVIHSATMGAGVSDQQNSLMVQTFKDSHVVNRNVKQNPPEHNISESSNKNLREFGRTSARHSISTQQTSNVKMHIDSTSTGQTLNQLQSQYKTMDSVTTQDHVIADQRHFNHVSNTDRDSSVTSSCMQIPAMVPQYSTKSQPPSQKIHFSQQNVRHSFQSIHPNNQATTLTAASDSIPFQHPPQPLSGNISNIQEANLRTDNSGGMMHNSVSNNPAVGVPLLQGSNTYPFPLPEAGARNPNGHYLVPFSGYSHTNWPFQYTLVPDPATGFMQMLPLQYIPFSHMQTSQDIQFLHNHRSDLDTSSLPVSGNKTYNTGHKQMDSSMRFPQEPDLFGVAPDRLLPSHDIQPYIDMSHVHNQLHSAEKYCTSMKPSLKPTVNHQQRHEEDNMQSTSTSPSKDSGISLNQHSDNLTYSMEKLRNADKVLSNVVHILQDTFAMDLSLDLGTEDISIGKYIRSLACLTWETFCHAVMEKYVHLVWSSEVLSKLYEAIGGHESSELKYSTESMSTKYRKPQHRQKTDRQQSELLNDQNSDRDQQTVQQRIKEKHGKLQITTQEQQHRLTRQFSNYNQYQHESKHLSSQHHQERSQRQQISHKMQQIFKQQETGSQEEQQLFNHNYSVTAAIPVPSLYSVRLSPPDYRPRSEMKKQKYLWNETTGSADSEMRHRKQTFQKACELDKTKRSSSLHNINFTSLSSPVFHNIDIEKNQRQRVNSVTAVHHNNQHDKDNCSVKPSYSNKRQAPSQICEDNSTDDTRISANLHVNKTNMSSPTDTEQMAVTHFNSAHTVAKFTETCDGYNSPSSLASRSSSSKSDGSQEHRKMYTKSISSSKNKRQYLQDTKNLSKVAVNVFPLQSPHIHSAPPADLRVNRNNTDFSHFRSQMSQHSKPNNSQEQWSESGQNNNIQEVTHFIRKNEQKLDDIENQTSTIARPVSETVLDYYKLHGQKQHKSSPSNELTTIPCQDMNHYSHSNNNLPTEVRKLAAKKPELYNNRCSTELSLSQETSKNMRTQRFTDNSQRHPTSQSEASVCDNGHQSSRNHQASGSSHFSSNFDSKMSDSSQTLVKSTASLTYSRTPDTNVVDNNSKKPYSRSLSATYFRQSNQQPKGVTVLPVETKWDPDTRQRRGSNGSVQLSEVNIKLLPYTKRSNVVYHSAMVQLNLTPEVDTFIHSVDEENRPAIEKSLTSINQEIAVQRRQRLKTQSLFRKLNDQNVAGKKGDQNVIEQILSDMAEMTRKLSFLYLCQTHYEMLLAELHGLDASLLYSLAVSEGSSSLNLQPVTGNLYLQFRTISALDGEQMTVLQAGTPRGLMSYLYTSSALSIGYIHQFLLCFRYILTADQLLIFIIERYNSARRSNQKDVNMICIQCRSTDLLHFWLEGFYSIDFAPNKALLKKFADFLAEQTNANMETTDSLFSLYAACRMGENAELMHMTEMNQDTTEDGAYFFCMDIPKRWDSFRSLLKRSRSDKSKQGSSSSFGKNRSNIKTLSPEHGKSSSPFSLADCSADILAEQLTLIEQELFKKCHPVHYLNSQFQGVGVALSMPGLRTPSMTRKSEASQGPKKGLFVGDPPIESYVVNMINHSQELAHWVSAEILSSGSSKAQINLIMKFLTAAHLCQEVRNYATALSILDGLENLVIRQLPVWKHIPAKAVTYMDALTNIKMKLKSEALWLMKEKDWYMYPTIPCALFFALHIQQVEIGSFTLANGMYKWDKMRSITDIVDQLRIFRDHNYGFQPDFEIQRFLHRCLAQYSEQDLHMVASAHDSNFHRHPSTTSLSGTLKKVKGIFKKKV